MQIRILATFFHDYKYGKVLGGVERRFLEISKEFKKQNAQVFAIEYEPSLSKSFSNGYISIALKRTNTAKKLGKLFEIFKLGLITTIVCRRLRCNVIYSPSSVYSNLIPAYIASKLCGLPLVIVFHSFPYGRTYSILKDFSSLIVSLPKGRKNVSQALIVLLRNRAFLSAKACLTVSNSTKLQLINSFRPRLVIKTGNGISEDWFSNVDLQKIYDACYVGRISPRKRIEFLLNIWHEVVSAIPNAKLVMVGGAENQNYYDTCLKKTRELNLEKNIIFMGFVNDDSLRKVLSSSRTFVTTSSREGFGLSILEAMSQKVPCILPSLPALKEIFGEYAVFVEGDDLKDWSRAVLDLLSDAQKSSLIAEKAFMNSLKYSWHSVANTELNVFERLLNSNRK